MRTSFVTPFVAIPFLILAVDGLTWPAGPGCGMAFAALICGLLLVFRFPHLTKSLAGCGALTWLVLSSLAGIWDQGWLPTMQAIGALATMAVIGRCGSVADGFEIGQRILANLLDIVTKPIRDARLARHWRSQQGKRTWRIVSWGLPLVFGAVFAGLFLIANPVLTARASAFADWISSLLTLPEPLRVLCWILIASGGWWFLRSRWQIRATVQSEAKPRANHIGLVQRSLIIFHGLFLVQNGCDFAYLWGGLNLPEGMSYADYAHRGAYPLVATALLAAGFVLLWFRPGSPVQADRRCRALVSAWLGQNVVLLGSALWRLHLYVDVYGLTRWRVCAAVWMALVGIGLGLIAWRIVADRTNRWLVNANLGAATLTLFMLAWLDIDGFIVRHNLAHTQRGAAFDVAYIESLGYAALPELRRFATSGNREIQETVRRLEAQLEQELADWRSWTLRKEMWRPAQSIQAR